MNYIDSDDCERQQLRFSTSIKEREMIRERLERARKLKLSLQDRATNKSNSSPGSTHYAVLPAFTPVDKL